MTPSKEIAAPLELYRPRAVAHVGVWHVEQTSFKIYGILADGKSLTKDILFEANEFVHDELPASIMAQGFDNGLGFIIIHPGELGVSILVHWWVQGSVLCLKIRRKLYGAREPIDMTSKPVVACVWELGLIDAERQIWRDTMMTESPSASAYLDARVAMSHV